MKSFSIETWIRSISIERSLKFLHNPNFKYPLIATLTLVLIYFATIRFLEYRIFESRIQVNDIRNFITQVINDDLSKAVDLGIIEFSLWEGILIEDLMISQEEDFTYNRKLLQSKKIGLKLSSLFSKQPFIKKIKIIDPKIQIDTGDDFFTSLVDYLLKANIQEVEFSGLQIDVFDSDEEILNIRQKTDWVFHKTENQIEFQFTNGWFWIPFATRIQGNGVIQLQEAKTASVQLNVRWKNLEIQEISGLATWIHLFQASEGKTNGNLQIQNTATQRSFTTDSEWNAMNGNFIFWNNVNWDELSFKNHFSFREDLIAKTISYKRSYSNHWGEWKLTQTQEKELGSGKLEWKFPEMEDLVSYIPSWQGIQAKGSFEGILDWKETGTRNNWFLFSGKTEWVNGEWRDQQIHLTWNRWIASIDENQLKSNSQGQIFSSDFSFTANSKLQFWKSIRPDKSNYYPVGINGSIETKLDSLNLQNWQNLKSKIFQYIQREIKERQEKIIPEEYFTQQKIYKYLLEEMNISWNGSIQNVIVEETGAKSQGWNHSIVIQSGRVSAKAFQQNTNNLFSFSSQFATKSPYIEFTANLNDFIWKKPILQLCGMNLVPNSFDLEYRFRSSGSDFYSFTKQGNHSSVWVLKNTIMKEPESNEENTNQIKQFPIPGWNTTDTFELSFENDHYFENSYFRSIKLISQSGNEWKGFGSTKNNIPNYTLYGKVGNDFTTIQLVDIGESCK